MDDSIAGLRLPNLRVADFSYNQIKDPNSIVKVMKRSPVLEHIVLHNNPLTQNQLWKTMVDILNFSHLNFRFWQIQIY